MSNKNIIRVSEFEKLYYDDKKPFKQKHWEALFRYLEQQNKKETKRTDYFRILNKGIQFTNFVGVIQAGNLTIEILPKTDKSSTTAANETFDKLEQLNDKEAVQKTKWHKVLLDMLKECRLLKVNHVDNASLNLRSNSILDIYIELFLLEAEQLLHEGLLKKYRKQEGNQSALKGQLQFAKQVAYNTTHQERFYVRNTEYNRDNIYNSIIYKTICIIPKISNNNLLLDKVGRLLIDFPEVSNCSVTEETFNKLTYDRKTERYKEALLISKMLLLNFRPDITGGTEDVMAILFDMNKLWEEFVYRRLKKEEDETNFTVHRQQSEDFWKCDELSRPKTIRPDIVIRQNNPTQTIIVDTKWKMVEDLIPGDDDLKQMYIYNLFWDCVRSILLYPSKVANHNHGDYVDYRDKHKQHTKCSVQTISVFNDEDKLDKCFGSKLIELLNLE